MRVLVVNAGSSSLKLQLVHDGRETGAARTLDAPRGRFDTRAAVDLLREHRDVDAVGHRVVHGGERFDRATLVQGDVRERLLALAGLAPLHQPAAVRALDAAREAFPGIPHYCSFDTAFHRSIPPAAATYAIPREWRARWGLRRFGFHGISHAWVARRAPRLLGRAREQLRIVSCHLGAGASVCAIADGRSVDTTMGFTPLEGLVMATRCGSVDPGMLLWLLRNTPLDADALAHALQEESGLLALAGTADMRSVLERADDGDGDAQLALDVFAHRLRAAIAAMSASMGGLDVLAFTGGIGERSPAVRAAAASGLAFLGIELDDQRNARAAGDADVTGAGARVSTLVLSAREDLEIARQGTELLGAAGFDAAAG